MMQGGLEMVPDMVKQFVVYFYRHIRWPPSPACPYNLQQNGYVKVDVNISLDNNIGDSVIYKFSSE